MTLSSLEQWALRTLDSCTSKYYIVCSSLHLLWYFRKKLLELNWVFRRMELKWFTMGSSEEFIVKWWCDFIFLQKFIWWTTCYLTCLEVCVLFLGGLYTNVSWPSTKLVNDLLVSKCPDTILVLLFTSKCLKQLFRFACKERKRSLWG